MKRKKFRSIQFNIFLSITVITMGVICFALLFYSLTSATVFKNNYQQSSNQLAKIISANIDNEIRDVDNLQIRMLSNEDIREAIFDIDKHLQLDVTEISNVPLDLRRQIYGLTGYELGFYHLDIHLSNGLMIHFGQKYEISHRPKLQEDGGENQAEYERLMQPVNARRGSMYLGGLQEERIYDLQKYYANAYPTITVSRSFSRTPLFSPQAVMEIHISTRVLQEAVDAALLSYDSEATRVVIYDDRGGLIFPSELTPEEQRHYIESAPEKKIKNPETGVNELTSKYRSDYTGWTLALITPYDVIDAGTKQYMTTSILIGLIAVCVTLFIAFWIAKSVAAPIVTMQQALTHLELDNLTAQSPYVVKTKYNELDMLQNAMFFMQERLEKSLKDHIRLRSLSIESRMIALQSQMNPHFLYNTLSIMAILAEENGDDDVSRMCHQLVHMLRYISSDAETTTFDMELAHLKRYAELIEMRYGPKVQITYDIAQALYGLSMPPLILQPLVENSVKYAMTSQGVLKIEVSARVEDGFWIIRVQDNGPGFPDKALREFEEKVRKQDDLEKIVREGVSGIGLANTYVRLKLSYGIDNFIFRIDNSSEGASITVGGQIEGEEHDG